MDSSSATAATVAPVVTSAPPLEDCLRLLRGERDEQKLAGLLVAANVCRAGDADAVANVYRAVGPRFLRRLLNTGLGKVEGGKEEEREAYMRLAVTVLAGLARVPEVAADEGVVSTVPLVAEVVAKSTDPAITEECFELLSLIAIASEDGAYEFCEPGVIDMIFLQILSLTDGSKCVELAINLLQLLVHKLKVDTMSSEKLQGMTRMVTCLARIFAVLHTAVKFDALHMLTFLLSQKESGEGLFCSPPMAQNSQSTSCAEWAVAVVFGSTLPKSHGAECFQIGVSSEKLHALLLAECMMSILGEDWLSEDFEVQDNQNVLSVDKFVLLVLESARVEVAVLLNELAYLKYESSKISQTDEAISQKQRNLAILFSLIERIIKMISNASSGEGAPIHTIRESTIMQAITGLNETINLVLDFLQDAKDHGQWKGDDLLAAARIVGSYLAEAPYACKEKTGNLLEFIFSIEGQDESSSFYSICFMLPMLSQITMEVDGCRTLASFGGHKAVIDCLVKMTEQGGMTIDNGSMFLACDTIINFMSNMKSVHIPVDYCFIRLLKALVTWAGTTDASSVTMTASCLCVMLLDMTSEKFLLSCSHFDANILGSLSEIIIRSLQQDIPDDDSEQFKQKQIIVSGYKRWADRFPRVKDVVEQHVSV
ncbi:neurochondrin family protein [Zea mays]|uniref:Neurochondrin family protein n=3 Tax=Zea mays TaxID=4577 RepID=A0A1D6HNH2_MAIZE|nr:neurochondrin family protein [Zea mays]